LALDTRNTRCPRAEKNTATGNHAGPVGSITTSRTVPAGVPANAAASIRPRLSTVGSHRRRHTTRPSPSSTRTVCELAIPRSTPTSRLTTTSQRSRRYRTTPVAAEQGDDSTTTAPRVGEHLTRLPLMRCKRARPRPGRPTSLIRGIRGQASGGNQLNEANRRQHQHRLPSELYSTPPHRTNRDAHATPGTPDRSRPELLT
jgi:hypothetical protein